MPYGPQNCPLPHPLALISSGWARKGAFLSGSLPAPSPTPQALFPPVLFRMFVWRRSSGLWAPWGLPRPAFPAAWSCFSAGHHCLLPSVLAMSRLAWCPGHSLHGGMTQQEMFPKQGCVESLTACGLGHISLVGALLALFLLKQERQLLCPVCPIDTAAGLTSVSSYVHGVSCGHTSPAAPKAAVGLSSPQTSEPWHLTERTETPVSV